MLSMNQRTTTRASRKRTRMCVGCSKRVERSEQLVRCTFVEEVQTVATGFAGAASNSTALRVVVDVAGRKLPGRGAWMHPHRSCVEQAVRRGFSKSARRPVKADVEALMREMVIATERRVASILAVAVRSRKVVLGATAVSEVLEQDPTSRGAAQLLVLATDAGAALSRPAIAKVLAGEKQPGQLPYGCLVYGDGAQLGAMAWRSRVVVLAVVDVDIARGLSEAISLRGSLAGEKSSERERQIKPGAEASGSKDVGNE
jgi:uncharacterized protein